MTIDFDVEKFYKKMMNADPDKKELYATMRCLIGETWLDGSRWKKQGCLKCWSSWRSYVVIIESRQSTY